MKDPLQPPKKGDAVYLLCSRCTFPAFFAWHHWLVTSEDGKLSKWEVLMRPGQSEESWRHLHRNHCGPQVGIPRFPLLKRWRWQGRVLGSVKGPQAKAMITVIASSPKKYPHKNYRLFGPNSNTYVQWVLDQFPDCNLQLHKGAYGARKK